MSGSGDFSDEAVRDPKSSRSPPRCVIGSAIQTVPVCRWNITRLRCVLHCARETRIFSTCYRGRMGFPSSRPPRVILHAALQIDEILPQLLQREAEREHRFDLVGGERQRQAFAAHRLDLDCVRVQGGFVVVGKSGGGALRSARAVALALRKSLAAVPTRVKGVPRRESRRLGSGRIPARPMSTRSWRSRSMLRDSGPGSGCAAARDHRLVLDFGRDLFKPRNCVPDVVLDNTVCGHIELARELPARSEAAHAQAAASG